MNFLSIFVSKKHKGKKPNKLWNQEKPKVAVTVKISFFSQNSERKYYTQIATSRLSKLHWVRLQRVRLLRAPSYNKYFFLRKENWHQCLKSSITTSITYNVYPNMHWGSHTPPPSAHSYCCGRYASYWNACLLWIKLLLVSGAQCMRGI